MCYNMGISIELETPVLVSEGSRTSRRRFPLAGLKQDHSAQNAFVLVVQDRDPQEDTERADNP